MENKILLKLFTRKGCGICKFAESSTRAAMITFSASSGKQLDLEIVDVTDDPTPAIKYGLKKVPSLVIEENDKSIILEGAVGVRRILTVLSEIGWG